MLIVLGFAVLILNFGLVVLRHVDVGQLTAACIFHDVSALRAKIALAPTRPRPPR